MTRNELASIDHHYKVSLERLQRLYKATPAPVVFFLAGSLPAKALLHLRQLSLFGMIARLGPSNILFQLGWSILRSDQASSHSWFHQIEDISEKYSLPPPLTILASPPTKSCYKRTVKMKILDWWRPISGLRLLYYHPSLSSRHISCPSPPLTQSGHLLEAHPMK